jgi:SAM-dependent methyltransferase
MNTKLLAAPLFDLDEVFNVDDYFFAYQEDLTDERSDREVANLVNLLMLDQPMKILDLACGFGRHTNRLAALGHRVTGIDYMPGFLEIARKNAAELGLDVYYRQGDMRTVDFQEEFDRVVLLFTSFGYFEDNENEDVLRNMVKALKPNGLLLLDIPNRDVFLKDIPPSSVFEKGNDFLINRTTFDCVKGRMVNKRILIRDGKRIDKPFSIRLYNATEMCQLLERIGVKEYQLLGEDSQPISMKSRRMYVIARKKG